MWQSQCKGFVDAVVYDHKWGPGGYEKAASALVNYIEGLSDEERCVMLDFIHCLNAMVEVVDPIEEVYCYCCGRRSVTVQECPQCGAPLCQDCAPPFGGHVCELD